MGTIKRGFARVAASVAAAIALGLGALHLGTWHMLETIHDDVPVTTFASLAEVTEDDRAEGERLAVIVGCWAGCHGMRGEGGSDDSPGLFDVTAPTLSDVLPAYSDHELVRLVRYGIKRDGRTAIGMSAGTFFPLADRDLARIFVHLRAQPVTPPVARHRTITLAGRYALATGKWTTSAGEVDRRMPRWGELPRRTAFERGRYLASITCTECHGLGLTGKELMHSPPMDVVLAYDAAQFAHLLRTGQPLDRRDLGIMSWVARVAFARFSDEEISDLYTYLRSFRAAPPNIGDR